MVEILNGIFQSFFEWQFGLFLTLLSFIANSFIQVMTMDTSFFEQYAPIVLELHDTITAVGWALLLGNLVFQAMKIMMAGSGVQAENPASLIARTGLYGFLLLCSRQIFGLGLGMGARVIKLIEIPTVIKVTTPDPSILGDMDGSWFIVCVLTVIVGFSLMKMFFSIGERYVVLCVLVLFAPLGFAMGGSKATKDIATGYIRMFASMVLMVILNLVFLKLVLSVLATIPNETTVIPWVILIVGLSRVATKADSMVAKIGLNPVIGTEAPLPGRGIATALVLLGARSMLKGAVNKFGGGKSGGSIKSGGVKSGGGGAKPSGGTGSNSPPVGVGGAFSQNQQNSSSGGSNNRANTSHSANSQSSQSTTNRSQGNNRNSNNSVSVGGTNQKLDSQQKLNSSNNNSMIGSATNSANSSQNNTNQGGNAMAQHNTSSTGSATQINTNRFGVVGVTNSKNNANSVNSANSTASNRNVNALNSHSSVNQGKNANTINNQGSSVQNSVNQSNNSVPAVSAMNSPAFVSQGKKSVPAVSAKSSPASVSQGKKSVPAVSPQSPPATVPQSKKAVPAVLPQSPTATVSKGKNGVSANSVKSAQSHVKQGKKDVSTNSVKPVQSPVKKGRNAVSANPKNASPTVVSQGKKPLVHAPKPAKPLPTDVTQGNNNVAPIDVNGNTEIPNNSNHVEGENG